MSWMEKKILKKKDIWKSMTSAALEVAALSPFNLIDSSAHQRIFNKIMELYKNFRSGDVWTKNRFIQGRGL